jgi:tetratricopeptide (TPR) repeat protein
MPLFGGSKRPKLDGLTKEEEKRRDALNPEVMRRAGEKGVAGQGIAALGILREKTNAEHADFLWPWLLGSQYLSFQRYTPAIEAFNQAIERDAAEVRGYYGAGTAYFQAGEAKLNLGAAATEDVVPPNLTPDNLYHEALRNFKKALDLTDEKSERDQLQQAVAAIDRALARRAGRL